MFWNKPKAGGQVEAMPKYRALAFATVALLIVGHVVLLSLRYGTQAASVWGDWFGIAAALLATVACWVASCSAGPFGRRVWRLVSLSAILALVAQALFTYQYDYAHAPLGTLWSSDVLVFFWAVPAMMALFLSPRDPNSGFRWLRTCDFAQVCTLVMALELAVVYVPSRWQVAGQAMETRALQAGIVFFGLITLSFLIRSLLTPFRTVRRLFQRLAVFFFVFTITTNITLSALTSSNYQQGMWPDLLWTVTYCLLAVLAVTWNDSEQRLLENVAPPSRSEQLVSQFSPLLIPAIVFPLVLRISQEQFFWSVVLVMVSFAAASGRMFLLQNQLLMSSGELQKNLSLLQGIIEGTPDAVFVKDLHGHYLMINSWGAQLLGCSVEEVVGKDDTALFNLETAHRIMERDRAVVESGEIQTYEESGTSTGIQRTYLCTKGPYRDATGQVIGLFGIARDITNSKQVEEEIRQSQQKLRIHFEHTPLAVVEWDTDFRVATWNPAAERIFGYSREEALGQHAGFIVPPNFRDHVDKIWQDLLQQRGGTRSTNDNITKDGRTTSCEWYNTPLIDDSGRVLGVASFVHDLTERVVLEEKLRQSQKMEAIGRLAGGVAHDFNNLLTVILGYSQLLADGLPEGSRLADATLQIRSAADRATGITRQLLAFSRKQVLLPRVIDLNDIMMNLDTMLRRLIGEDIEVLSIPGRDLGSVKADPSQIEQVVINLALNARDAMPKGGKLTLETLNVQLDDTYAREHQPVEPGRYVMLAVSDTGFGMAAETQSRIFEPFYTTKDIGKGTGLGLSTVYGIVKQSGGYIWVYSEPDCGTTIKVYLPRVNQPAEALGDKRAPSVLRGTETVLLVEDDWQLRQLISSILAHCGYKLLVAGTGDEGLALCKSRPSDIQLLVTDVILPGMNGRQLAERVKDISPQTRVLYISGYTNNVIVHHGVLDAGLWFLPKPFSVAALAAKVREVLDSSPDALKSNSAD